jgi:spore maturation protein CgeB
VYEERFAPLLDQVGAMKRPAKQRVSLARVVPQPAWWLKAVRAFLTLPAVILFGPARGPRAARRLLFELSWRLCGPRTYSAQGWPGRLFYRES